MSADRRCCVLGCTENVRPLYGCPTERSARRVWLQRIGLPEDSNREDVFVCKRHFASEDYVYVYTYCQGQSQENDIRMHLTRKAVPTLFLPGEKVSTEERGRAHREVPTTAVSVGQSAASLATKEPASCSTDFEAVQRVASSEPSLLRPSVLEPCYNTAVRQTKVLSSSTGAGSSQASSILGLPVVVPKGSSLTGTGAMWQILPRPPVGTKSHDVQPSSATPTALTALSGRAKKPSQPSAVLPSNDLRSDEPQQCFSTPSLALASLHHVNTQLSQSSGSQLPNICKAPFNSGTNLMHQSKIPYLPAGTRLQGIQLSSAPTRFGHKMQPSQPEVLYLTHDLTSSDAQQSFGTPMVVLATPHFAESQLSQSNDSQIPNVLKGPCNTGADAVYQNKLPCPPVHTSHDIQLSGAPATVTTAPFSQEMQPGQPIVVHLSSDTRLSESQKSLSAPSVVLDSPHHAETQSSQSRVLCPLSESQNSNVSTLLFTTPQQPERPHHGTPESCTLLVPVMQVCASQHPNSTSSQSSTAPPVVLGHIITLPTLKLISSATGLVGQEAAASSVPVSDMAEQPVSGDLTKSGNAKGEAMDAHSPPSTTHKEVPCVPKACQQRTVGCQAREHHKRTRPDGWAQTDLNGRNTMATQTIPKTLRTISTEIEPEYWVEDYFVIETEVVEPEMKRPGKSAIKWKRAEFCQCRISRPRPRRKSHRLDVT